MDFLDFFIEKGCVNSGLKYTFAPLKKALPH
jgi:hypothetical protein